MSTVPLVGGVPAGVLLFWVISNSFALTRAYLVRYPTVRRFFKVPFETLDDPPVIDSATMAARLPITHINTVTTVGRNKDGFSL